MYSTVDFSSFQVSSVSESLLYIPSNLPGFIQRNISKCTSHSSKTVYCFIGSLEQIAESERTCPVCGSRMHIKETREITLRPIPFGSSYTVVKLDRERLYCDHCGHSHMRDIPFKADGHHITTALKQYAEDLLASGTVTVKKVAELAGLGQHTVAAIDKARLSRLYTDQTEQGPVLKKPDTYSEYLAIDEFKLHNGHQYATHIIDLESGNVLWIARGKKKQVVYDFIDHAGMDWMEHVKAVACDMNSDFQEAFEERCEWISIVFDHFHIVKNLNVNVIAEVRKEVQNDLIKEGDLTAARQLKRSKYLLMSSEATLESKDARGRKKTVLKAENTLFGLKPVIAKTGYVGRYRELIQSNSLFVACDLVKEMLDEAFRCTSEEEMADKLTQIIDTCRGTRNRHFEWFARLIENHFQGILSHASFRISSGKIEGINNKIKTVRRQAYGYKDDGYFFLKIIDASRHVTVRNPASHRILH